LELRNLSIIPLLHNSLKSPPFAHERSVFFAKSLEFFGISDCVHYLLILSLIETVGEGFFQAINNFMESVSLRPSSLASKRSWSISSKIHIVSRHRTRVLRQRTASLMLEFGWLFASMWLRNMLSLASRLQSRCGKIRQGFRRAKTLLEKGVYIPFHHDLLAHARQWRRLNSVIGHSKSTLRLS